MVSASGGFYSEENGAAQVRLTRKWLPEAARPRGSVLTPASMVGGSVLLRLSRVRLGFWIPVEPLPALWVCRRWRSDDVKVRSYLQYLRRKIRPPKDPPYGHVCQVGDPVLRTRAAAVDPGAVGGPEVQKVLGTMVRVMKELECVGLSAPQVGVPLRILMLEFPWRMLEEASPAARAARGLSFQPLRVFVNPELRVLDGRTVVFQEACESVSGYSAAVPRYLAVEVAGASAADDPTRLLLTGAGCHTLPPLSLSDLLTPADNPNLVADYIYILVGDAGFSPESFSNSSEGSLKLKDEEEKLISY